MEANSADPLVETRTHKPAHQAVSREGNSEALLREYVLDLLKRPTTDHVPFA